jgi:hypothetical protein
MGLRGIFLFCFGILSFAQVKVVDAKDVVGWMAGVWTAQQPSLIHHLAVTPSAEDGSVTGLLREVRVGRGGTLQVFQIELANSDATLYLRGFGATLRVQEPESNGLRMTKFDPAEITFEGKREKERFAVGFRRVSSDSMVVEITEGLAIREIRLRRVK